MHNFTHVCSQHLWRLIYSQNFIPKKRLGQELKQPPLFVVEKMNEKDAKELEDTMWKEVSEDTALFTVSDRTARIGGGSKNWDSNTKSSKEKVCTTTATIDQTCKSIFMKDSCLESKIT